MLGAEQEQMGLFTFYMQQQQQSEQPAYTQLKKKTRRGKERKTETGCRDQWETNAHFRATYFPSNHYQYPQLSQEEQQKHFSEKTTQRETKMQSQAQGYSTPSFNIKELKSKSTKKYPVLQDSVSTPALLKANLYYLTTEHSDQNKTMEEKQPILLQKLKRCKGSQVSTQSKPVLKGIDLNQNINEIMVQVQKKKCLPQKRKPFKTKYSIKATNQVKLYKGEQPLISKMIKERQQLPFLKKDRQERTLSKMQSVEKQIIGMGNKLKKVQSQKLKNPSRNTQQVYFQPLQTDRKGFNYSMSVEHLQLPPQYRLSEMQKPVGKSKTLKKEPLQEKPTFSSEKSYLLKTLFLHDCNRTST